MFDRIYLRISEFVRRHKVPVLAVIGITLALSVAHLPRVRYDNNIEIMLPQRSDVLRDMRFLREAGFSDKVLISLGLTDEARSTEELIRSTDALAAALKGAWVTEVTSGISSKDLAQEMRSYLRLFPQVVTAQELERLDARLNPQGVDAALRADYLRLLTPAGVFLAPLIAQDPLGIRNRAFLDLQALSNAVGYSGVVEQNHFISRDGRHALLILSTPVAISDGFGARRLIGFLNERIRGLPGYVRAGIIAAHTHTVSNEDAVKKDIVRTSAIASIAFLLIFFLAFRDVRAVIFFLIPLGAVLVAINLASFVFPALSYFMLGMVAVIVGLADDYGIHVYVAVRTAGTRDAVRLIVKPLLIAALTTGTVFAAFFFSQVRGYHQLAFFTLVSVFLCLGFVVFVFPHFLKETRPGLISAGDKVPGGDSNAHSGLSDRGRVLVWLLILLVFFGAGLRVRFSSDLNQFDGSSREVFNAEEDFKRAWGITRQPAFLVSAASTEEQALEQTEAIGLKAEDLVTFTSLWPSLKARTANAERWRKFWAADRQQRLQALIAGAGPKYGFAEDAFKPFFEGLSSGLDTNDGPQGLEFFSRLKERFVRRTASGYQVISFFPDDIRHLQRMRSLSAEIPDVFIVSRKALERSISGAIASEVVRLSVIAFALIVLLTFILLRDMKLTLISLLSVVSAVTAVAGTFSMLGRPLNAACLIAVIVVVGLCIDYGVFMLYSFRHSLETGTAKAVWVSAATSLIGAFALLFASHPVLFSIGLTLVAGLSAGFLCSQFIVPAFYRLWIAPGVRAA